MTRRALPHELQGRVWRMVQKTDGGCWLWRGSTRDGYARIDNLSVHRLTYEWMYGPIPSGLTIDHLCNVRHCVRPEHLEAVTQRVNQVRVHCRPRSDRPRVMSDAAVQLRVWREGEE